MKVFYPIFLLLLCAFTKAQRPVYELIDMQSGRKHAVKDSAAAAHFLDSLAQHNFYFTEVKKVDSTGGTTQIYFDKGKNYNEAQISLDAGTAQFTGLPALIHTKNLDSVRVAISQKYEKQGYAFSRVKTKFTGLKNGVPQVQISVIKERRRMIDALVLRDYERTPTRFKKNLDKRFVGRTYGEENMTELQQSLQNHPFVLLKKPPQTLFTRDSTQVFLFLQKKKTNTFDGIVGFGNDKSDKFTFNGSINVNFRNMFNSFETVNIFWQRNPDRGQTFDLRTDIPYLFGSNVGTNINVNIYRQDSTFATVKLLPSVYLHLDHRQKLGLRGRFETSTVTDSLFAQGRDFTKRGIGLWYEFTEPSEVELFLFKTRLRAEGDLISTTYPGTDGNFPQNSFALLGERNFHIRGNHYLNLRGETALITSKDGLLANEMLRFGGWNSFRGFNENALLADFYYYGSAEYRYLVGRQAFFDVFGQYGQLHNKSLDLKPQLYSVGLGFNFFLPVGLMSFQISNGTTVGSPFKFGETKIHWGLLSRF